MAEEDNVHALEAVANESEVVEASEDTNDSEETPTSEEGEEGEGDSGAENEEEDEEELEDPQETLREKCGETTRCKGLKEELGRCNERVKGRTNTNEKCEQELFDFIHCIDQCASRSLFSKLK
eukprot:m.307673 g.307673  ORF g.307673 m.307673 type:complete len:123 (+) comp42608_c0_seq1:37-405(+)